MHGGMGGYGKHMMHHKGGMHGRHGTKLLSPHWKQTLTPAQRVQIDQMHLNFAKAKATLKTKIKALRIELALLSTADKANNTAIENKIEELLKAKNTTI